MSETISSGRRRKLPPDPDATLGKSHDREFIGNCGDHGSTKTQSTSTVNHSKRSDKSKSTRDGDEKPITKCKTDEKRNLVFCISHLFQDFLCQVNFLISMFGCQSFVWKDQSPILCVQCVFCNDFPRKHCESFIHLPHKLWTYVCC